MGSTSASTGSLGSRADVFHWYSSVGRNVSTGFSHLEAPHSQQQPSENFEANRT